MTPVTLNQRFRSPRFYALAIAVLVLLWIWYSSDKKQEPTQATGVKKVNVTVFYEVLCPDSKHFLLRQLLPTWKKVPEIMSIDLRPFGKAKYSKNEGGEGYVFTCQHGPTECLGNMVHNCAVKHVEDFFAYVACMMEDNYDPMAIGKKCAERLSIDWEAVKKCTEGQEGPELMSYAGATTLGINPRLSFIPSITLDGSFEGQNSILKNLLPQVCNAYKGEKPESCKSSKA